MKGARLCVVIVSDYEGPARKTWEAERLALAAFDRQDIAEPFDVLLIESAAHRGCEPADLTAGRPRVRVLYADESASARLKDFGVRQTDAEFVAVVEADSVPDASWLRVLLSSLREHPECCVASGRTTYGEENSYRRVLGALPNPGALALPLLWCGRRLLELRNMLRCRSRIRWFDAPLLLVLAPLASLLEVPGMLDARNGRSAIPGSAYR